MPIYSRVEYAYDDDSAIIPISKWVVEIYDWLFCLAMFLACLMTYCASLEKLWYISLNDYS